MPLTLSKSFINMFSKRQNNNELTITNAALNSNSKIWYTVTCINRIISITKDLNDKYMTGGETIEIIL